MKKYIIFYSLMLLFSSCSNNNKENQYEKEHRLAQERLEKESEKRRKADEYYANMPGGSNFAYDVTGKDLNGKTFKCINIIGFNDPETGSQLGLKFQFKYRNNLLRGVMTKSTPIPNTKISSDEQLNFTAEIKDKHIIVNLPNNLGYFIFTYFPDRNEPNSNVFNVDIAERLVLRNFQYDEVHTSKENLEFYVY